MDSYLYKEEILDHYKNPQNFGVLATYHVSSKQLNPLCGDEIEMFIRFEKNSVGGASSPPQGRKIHTITFVGHGCAISIAATSMLTEFVRDKKKTELTKFSQENMLDLLGIDLSETRRKCALLGWAVLQDCLR